MSTVAVDGTATESIVETELLSAGETIRLTLTGDTWISSGVSYADIIFYWGMEGADADKSAGDTTPTYLGTPPVARDNSGTPAQPLGSWILKRPGGATGQKAQFTVASDDIFNHASGRLGFFWYSGDASWTFNKELFTFPYNATNRLRCYTDTGGVLRFEYFPNSSTAVYVTKSGFVVGTWYFLEFRWDQTAGSIGIFADGGAESAQTGTLTGWTSSAATINFGDHSLVTDAIGYYDQIIISNDYTRDLYALRNTTSFPD